MIKKYVIRLVNLFLFPFKYVVYSEIKNILDLQTCDISLALQRRATESTVDYIIKNMKSVDSVSSTQELLKKSLTYAELENGNLICEFGVFSGQSINYIASQVKNTVFGFDSFEGLPERWRDGFTIGFFKVDRLPKVSKNVVLIKGWFNDSLPIFVEQYKSDIAFLHIDCDLYSSTKTIFYYLGSKIKSGTVIVFDEYFNYPDWENGEIKAFHEFLSESDLKYEYIGYNKHHEQVAVKII